MLQNTFLSRLIKMNLACWPKESSIRVCIHVYVCVCIIIFFFFLPKVLKP